MSDVAMFGLDLAKNVSHIIDVMLMLVTLPSCAVGYIPQLRVAATLLVGMGACAASHYRAWEIGRLWHAVGMMPPAYVKP